MGSTRPMRNASETEMSVVVSIEDAGICRKRVKIEVPAPAVEAELERVSEEYRKAARLPGFRKGKVPLSVIRQRFGEEIRNETVDRLVPRYWRQAQAETDLDPLLPPSVDSVDFEGETQLTFDALVEIRPEIRLGDIESFDLPEMDVEPTGDEIEQALEDVRRGVAEWKDADRPAARGDLVVGKLHHAGADGESHPPSPVTFEVGAENVWEELTLAATGQAAGSRTSFERGEGEERQELELEVESVRERDLPPLDDEFAAKVGKFDSLEELQKDLRERLQFGKERERRRAREGAVLEQLRERHSVELPSGVVDRETENILRAYAEDLGRQGIDPETAEIDWKELFDRTRPQGEREVLGRLILDAVVEKLEIEVSEDEFEASIAALAKVQGRPVPAVRQALDKAGRLGELRTQLARDTALKRLAGIEEPSSDDETDESKDG